MIADGQYGYYAPGSTHRRLCEVQNGNVYFIDDNRVLKASDYPGRFVRLVDRALFPAPEWDKYPWANYAWINEFDDCNYLTYVTWIYCAEKPDFDKESGRYIYKAGEWQDEYIFYQSPPSDESWRKLLQQRPAAVAQATDAAGECHQ